MKILEVNSLSMNKDQTEKFLQEINQHQPITIGQQLADSNASASIDKNKSTTGGTNV